MNIAILYAERRKMNGPEIGEQMIYESLSRKGNIVDLVDIANLSSFNKTRFDLVLNRVYASIANDDRTPIYSLLDKLKSFNSKSPFLINPYEASIADYDKYHQYKLMKGKVQTPETVKLDNNNIELYEVIKQLFKKSGGIIIKPNLGGRAHEIKKTTDFDEALSISEKLFSSGNYIAQQFVKSINPFDVRVCVYNGKVVYSHARSLISDNGEPWLGSISKGSKFISYDATKEEIDVALKATESIGAVINEVDIVVTKNGPYVIENNLTPNYDSGCNELVDLFTEECLKYAKSKK
jgi:glutathione synthase/RimK-type ligase-like ATP-grasp enzyme